MGNRKYVATLSIILGILTMLTMHSQLGQSTYAAPHTSGYNHGCSDAQISDPSQRYINQPGKGSDFHTDAFMQAYNEGFDACSGDSNSNSNDNSDSSDGGNGGNSEQTDNQQNNNQQNDQSGLTDKICNALNNGAGAALIPLLHLAGIATGGTVNAAIMAAQGYCAIHG